MSIRDVIESNLQLPKVPSAGGSETSTPKRNSAGRHMLKCPDDSEIHFGSLSVLPPRRAGATLVELLMAVAVGSLVLAIIAVFASTSAMSLARMLNYAE